MLFLRQPVSLIVTTKAKMSLLAGKTCLVTGSSRGIGAALACALAKEGAGSLIMVAHPHHEADLKQVG